MTAQKASTGNNLLSSGVKQSQSKGKFELPMLSNRSNSKQTLGATRDMSQNEKQVTPTSMSSSHNYLPKNQPLQKSVQMPPTMMTNAKGPSMARHYQTCKDAPTNVAASDSTSMNPSAPRTMAHKSPGKTFKHSGRNTVSAAQMTTLVGSGVRKQQFVKM